MSANAADEKPKNLWAFIETLISDDIQRLHAIDEDPPWYEPGKVCEVDEETYWFFLG